ncbi:MAG: hypothetical protein IJ769_04345, partial [Clostridia bacterium]|nr:hypothetical protein [Clostridia bacterium]
ARYIRIVEVTGSNPVCSTKLRKTPENVSFRAFFRIFDLLPDKMFGNWGGRTIRLPETVRQIVPQISLDRPLPFHILKPAD